MELPSSNNFSDSKWKRLFAKENGEFFVQELLEDIIKKSGDIVYHRYIERKVVPFAVLQAQKDVISLAEYLYFKVDEGEIDPPQKSNWIIDDEPQPIPIDSWARGALPTKLAKNITSLITTSNVTIANNSNTENDIVEERKYPQSIIKTSTPTPVVKPSSVKSASGISSVEKERDNNSKLDSVVAFRNFNSRKSLKKSSTNGVSKDNITPLLTVENIGSITPSREDSPNHISRSPSITPHLSPVNTDALIRARQQEEIEKLDKLRRDLKGRNYISDNSYTYDSVGQLLPVSTIDPERLSSPRISVKIVTKNGNIPGVGGGTSSIRSKRNKKVINQKEELNNEANINDASKFVKSFKWAPV